MRHQLHPAVWITAGCFLLLACSSTTSTEDGSALDSNSTKGADASVDRGPDSALDSGSGATHDSGADAPLDSGIDAALDGKGTTLDGSAGATLDGSAGTLDGSADSTPAVDGGLGCCPTGFSLYECQQPAGGTGMACHNPALGCASSNVCGKGCDPQVSGRCACVQTELCIVGDHFDRTLCKCVPNADAATVDAGPCDCKGALPDLCQVCSDGSTACAHCACVSGQCTVAYCP